MPVMSFFRCKSFVDNHDVAWRDSCVQVEGGFVDALSQIIGKWQGATERVFLFKVVGMIKSFDCELVPIYVYVIF